MSWYHCNISYVVNQSYHLIGPISSDMDIFYLDWVCLSPLNLRTLALILPYRILEKLVTWIDGETNKSYKMKTDIKVFEKTVGTEWEARPCWVFLNPLLGAIKNKNCLQDKISPNRKDRSSDDGRRSWSLACTALWWQPKKVWKRIIIIFWLFHTRNVNITDSRWPSEYD